MAISRFFRFFGWTPAGLVRALLLLGGCLSLVSCGDKAGDESAAEAKKSLTLDEMLSQAEPGAADEAGRQRRPRGGPPGREIARFRRGKYVDIQALGPGKDAAAGRVLVSGDTALDSRMSELIGKAGPQLSKQEGLALIAEASEIPSDKLPTLVDRLLSHADPEVRGRALAALEGVDHPGVLPVVGRALGDGDADVRLMGVELLRYASGDEAVGLLTRGLSDADANVRQLSLHVGTDYPPAGRDRVVKSAAESAHADVVAAALIAMEAAPNKTNVPYFIRAMNHSNADVSEQARDALALTFHEIFESPAQADAWWAANQHRYSPDLVLDVLADEVPKTGTK